MTSNQKKITVYTMDHCPFCERAKSLLKSRGYQYEEIKLDFDNDAAWEELEKRTNFKTMPQIFVGEKFCGGYNDLASLDSSGELKRLVMTQ